MIVCPRCSKENQDHYKFCLGCGAELPRDAAQPKSFTAPTPPAGVPAANPPQPQHGGGFASAATTPESAPTPVEPVSRPVAATAPPQPQAQPETLSCPQCGNNVPKNFKFCGSCGNDMTSVQAAAAVSSVDPPQPVDTVATPMSSPTGESRGSLVLIRPDGTEGEAYPLTDTTIVGRESAGPFASDSYLSPQHAEFAFQGTSLRVRDLDSLNGIYVRIAADSPVELQDGSVFRIGQEILRFEVMQPAQDTADGTEHMGSPNPGYIGRVRLVIGRDGYGNTYPVPATGMHLGRERGDIIFPEDGYVSGLHCRVHEEGGRIFLTDVGSSNGTFIRVEDGADVESGALLLMGQQLFRVEF